MKEVILCVKAAEGIFTFKYSNNGEETYNSIQELFIVFGDQPENKSCFIMTEEIRKRAVEYASQQSIKMPLFHQFQTFIFSIPIGNSFIILNGEPNNSEQQMYYNFLIQSSNESKKNNEIEGLINNKYEALPQNIKETIKHYNLKHFSQGKLSRVGEPIKNKRICRFCSRSMITGVKFQHKAHAISEGLGNKKIFTNEECDSCNDRFGKSIENDLLVYFDLFRTLAGLKGKKGYRKIEFEECSLFYDGKFLNMKFKEGHDDMYTSGGSAHQINLTYNHKITSVNVYKALCKFVISVIPNEELSYFKKTIKWLNGDLIIKQLPSIFTSFSIGTKGNDNTPQLMLYFRKVEDFSYPYLVAELTLNSSKTIFILPACKKDNQQFISEKEKELVKNTFCFKNREWEEKEYNNYKSASISQGYSLEMTPMDKPPEGYE